MSSRKRKAVTRDSPETDQAASFDELGNGPLNGIHEADDSDASSILSSSNLSFASEASDAERSGDDTLDSDDVPSLEDGEQAVKTRTLRPFSIAQDANGNPRYVYEDIQPHYDSDDSDAPANENTIGNIPLTFYDSYPHVGYDINGKRVMRPAKGAALDTLLDSIEVPRGWTGLTDPATGKPLELSGEELDVLKRLTRNEASGEGYDPYPEMVEYFSGKVEAMPLSSAPEPKRRFVPSKHEAKRVMKIVKAIKEGRIQPYRPPETDNEDEDETWRYDVWADEVPRVNNAMHMPAPKLPPPGYDQSYHPPPEYLPDEAEKKIWQDQDEEDRTKEYLPSDHDALRKVPGYAKFLKEKFERCLDLYLAPRVRRSKMNIDPETLLPKLPSPDDLRPFPSRVGLVMRGHTGIVRSVSFHSRGELLASGGDDGTVRIWGCDPGYQIWSVKLSDEAVHVVRWRPVGNAFILAAAAGDSVYLIAPDLGLIAGQEPQAYERSKELLDQGWSYQQNGSSSIASSGATTGAAGKWQRPEARLREQGVLVQVVVRSPVKAVSWHRRGEHFATVAPRGQRSALAIHTLQKHLTQLPLRSLKGLTQHVQFHPSKPILFVASQHSIRSYDLAKQELLKIVQPGAKWISSFDVHPGGDNLLVASYDKRLLWMDLDLSNKPYKTFRFHTKGIRAARYHQGGLPLFADASDDGSIQVFHGKVVGDLMENATIAPLTVLRGHKIEGSLGVMDIDWHPQQACCVSAGADGTCRLWVQ